MLRKNGKFYLKETKKQKQKNKKNSNEFNALQFPKGGCAHFNMCISTLN